MVQDLGVRKDSWAWPKRFCVCCLRYVFPRFAHSQFPHSAQHLCSKLSAASSTATTCLPMDQFRNLPTCFLETVSQTLSANTCCQRTNCKHPIKTFVDQVSLTSREYALHSQELAARCQDVVSRIARLLSASCCIKQACADLWCPEGRQVVEKLASEVRIIAWKACVL